MATFTTEQLDIKDRRSFSTADLDEMEFKQVELDPEIYSKKLTADILSKELGMDFDTVNTSYNSIIKNIYGQSLKQSQVEKRMQEDGILYSPKITNDEIRVIAKAVVEGVEPPKELMQKRFKREVIRQTALTFSRIREDEEKLFTEPSDFLDNINSKPDEPDVLYGGALYEEKDLLNFDTYKSLLSEAGSKQAVDDLRRERKALIANMYHGIVEQQADYFAQQEVPVPRNKYPKLTAISMGLYSATTTILRGMVGTSVAVGMEWNQPVLENIEKQLEEIGVVWETIPGKMPFVIGAVSEAIPNFAYNMTVGKMGIFITEYGNAYSDAKNNNATELQANAIAIPVGVINTAIEMMQLGRISKIMGKGAPAVATMKKAIKDRAWKIFLKKGAKFTGETLKASINEGIEGWLQEGVQIAMPAWVLGVYPKDENGNVDWFNILSQMNRSFIGEGIGGAFLGGAGSIYNSRQVSTFKTALASKLYINENLSEVESLQVATNITERLRNKEGNPQDIMREELGKVKMADNRHKATAHILKNGKDMGDEQYRAIANEVTGKNSIKDMNYDEAERFITALKTAEVEKVEIVEGIEKKEVTPEQIVKDVEAIRDETETQPEEYTEPTAKEGVGEEEGLSYRELQARAKELGIKANQSKDKLRAEIKNKRGFRGGFLDNAPIGDEVELARKLEELISETPRPKKVKKPKLPKEKKISKPVPIVSAIGQSIADAGKGLDRAFGMLSTRLRNVSPNLFQEVRNKYINPTLLTVADRVKEAHTLIDNVNSKLSKGDKNAFEIAQWQADKDTIDNLVKKYNLQDEYETYRAMLDVIYHEGQAVGLNMDYRDTYFPSAVKDFRGLMNELNRREEYEPIVMAMTLAESKKGRPLNKDEQIQLIDSLLRGYTISGITLARPGFAKERTVPREDISLMKYYYGFEEATSRYIEAMTEHIHARQFFGKTTAEIVKLRAGISRNQTLIAKYESDNSKDQTTNIKKAKTRIKKLQTELDKKDDGSLDNSIGVYVLDLINDGTIKYGQQDELLQIFSGIFQTKGSDKWIHTLRSMEYAGSLAQISAVITQYGEVVLPLLYAPQTALPNFVKAHLNKSDIKLKDIGVAHVGQEWVDADLDGIVKKTMKLFELADRVGKEAYINSIVDKYRKMAVKNPDKAKNEIRKFYPEDGVESVMNSLKSGEVDNNVKSFALNELAEVQPISKMEVPELYAKAGNWRVFYMYKTFVLKRLDILRREGYNEIKAGVKSGDKQRILKGIARLFWLGLMFMLADSSMDAVKDFIKGKPLDKTENYVIDNLLQMMMASKYSTYKLTREGLGSFLKGNIALPVSNIDAAVKDLMTLMDEDSEKGSEFARRIPWVGDMYYWYMGEGARKIDEGVYDEE